MPQKELRDYQRRAVLDLTAHAYDGERSLALVSPTGSGKSLMVLSFLRRVVPQRFTGALIVSPFLQIENSFYGDWEIDLNPECLAGSASRAVLRIREDEFLQVRGEDDARADVIEGFLHAEAPMNPFCLTTNAQVARFDLSRLPADLSSKILGLDEGKHSPTDLLRPIEDLTNVGVFALEWLRRGGTVLWTDATPWRHDGCRVFPVGTKVHLRTIAEHASSPFAPSHFQHHVVPLGTTRAHNLEELRGERLSDQENLRGSAEQMMVQTWVNDGRPKSIFNVPSGNSVEWTQRLIEALREEDPEVRILNAVGVGQNVADRVSSVLQEERDRADRGYTHSEVDVIISCQRFNEGSDWPFCSHVYNYGIPRHFGLILQRAGRAFRNKREIPNYPEHLLDVARITFFVPQIEEGLEQQVENQCHELFMLLACYMQNWDLAQSLRQEFQSQIEEIHNRMRAQETGCDLTQEEVEQRELEEIRADQLLVVPENVQAEARLLLENWQAGMENRLGRLPTAGEALRYLAGLEDLSVEVRQAVGELIAASLPEEARGEVLAQVAERVSGLPRGFLREDVREVFWSVISEYRDRTFRLPGRGMVSIVSEFSGRDAEQIAQRLEEQVTQPIPPMPELERAMREYTADEGEPPNPDSGDASKYFGYPVDWRRINRLVPEISRRAALSDD